jgi:geranylgeranyl pyrophosphate synthase
LTTDGKYASYVDGVQQFLASVPLLQQWPEMQQALLRGVSEEEPCMLALPCISCLAVGGVASNAIPVSAAIVALHQAARLIDAVRDNRDFSEMGCSSPDVAISLATGLIFASFHCLGLATEDSQRIQRLASLVSEATFLSAQGQYLGLVQDSGNSEKDKALEACWRVLITRSGGLFRMSTAGGAAVGTDSQHLVDALGEYGTCLGVMLQLLDDCRDIPEDSVSTRRGASLPLILLSMTCDDELDGATIPPSHSDGVLARRSFYETLHARGVPQIVSDILLEWQHRAINALAPLERSDAVTALERIAQDILVPGSQDEG